MSASEPIELRPIGASAPRIPPRHPDTGSPGTLGQAYRAAEDKARAAVHLQEGGLDTISVWGCGAASWYVHSSLHNFRLPSSLLPFQSPPRSEKIGGLMPRQVHPPLDPTPPLPSNPPLLRPSPTSSFFNLLDLLIPPPKGRSLRRSHPTRIFLMSLPLPWSTFNGNDNTFRPRPFLHCTYR